MCYFSLEKLQHETNNTLRPSCDDDKWALLTFFSFALWSNSLTFLMEQSYQWGRRRETKVPVVMFCFVSLLLINTATLLSEKFKERKPNDSWLHFTGSFPATGCLFAKGVPHKVHLCGCTWHGVPAPALSLLSDATCCLQCWPAVERNHFDHFHLLVKMEKVMWKHQCAGS